LIRVAIFFVGAVVLSVLLFRARNAAFYQATGLQRVAAKLGAGGVLGLWSNALPDEAFTARLTDCFARARTVPVTFHNPLQDQPFTQTVCLARTAMWPAI
jgi:hypothetical protein